MNNDSKKNMMEAQKIFKFDAFLSWGKNGTKYEKDRFISDCLTIYKRRNQIPPDELREIINNF